MTPAKVKCSICERLFPGAVLKPCPVCSTPTIIILCRPGCKGEEETKLKEGMKL